MRNDKYIALLLTVFSVFLIFSPIVASAATGGNLLVNPKFADGKYAWEFPQGSSLSSDVYYGSENSFAASITKEAAAGEISVKQAIYEIMPGATYRASAKLRGKLLDKDGFRLVVKFYSKAEGEFLSASSERYTADSQKKWVDISFDFVMPEKCDKHFTLWLRLDGLGTVYIDDVVLEKIANPEPFEIKTSHVFHYTGDKMGTAEVTLTDFYKDDSEEAGYTVRFRILDGLTVCSEQTMGFTNRKASFTYNVGEILKEKKKKYFFKIDIFQPGSKFTPFKSYSQGLYLFDRPTRLSAEGEYIIDGKVFHPVIGYHVNVEDYQKAKEAGINVVQISVKDSCYTQYPQDVETVLVALKEHELYGIFSLYTNLDAAGADANIENTQIMVEKLANDDRVFAWAVQDEPLDKGPTDEKLQKLEKSYYEIRKRDDMHPVYITDCNEAYFAYDVKYCDVFAQDLYSFDQQKTLKSTETACAVAKKAGNKPVYKIAPAYQNKTAGMPTGDIVRSVVYQAILGGADGIGFYSFSDCIPKDLSPKGENVPIYEVEQLWPTMLALSEEIPILFETAIRKSFTETRTEDYILRRYGFNGRRIVLPLCAENYTLPLDTDKTVTVLCGDKTRLSETTGGEKALLLGKYTPILWQYSPSGSGMLSVLQNSEEATRVSGTLEIQYTPGTADLYVVLYEKGSKKIKDIFMALYTREALVVTVPDGEYTLSAFAFMPGSLQPLAEKKSL